MLDLISDFKKRISFNKKEDSEQSTDKRYLGIDKQYDFLHTIYEGKPINTHEYFYTLLINDDFNEIETKCIAVNKGRTVSFSMWDIASTIYYSDAVNIILSHNHPSSMCAPSLEDYKLTESINNLCNELNKNLLDHIIYTPNNYYSFNKSGLLCEIKGN